MSNKMQRKAKVKRPDKFEPVENFIPNIGKRVKKFSGNPFKSSLKVNTVTEVIINEELGGVACYKFAEDDTWVECFRCVAVEENNDN